jgi:hypothetical protein
MIRVGDRGVCSATCDSVHKRNSIGIVTQIVWMAWPIKVEWLSGDYDYYEENELEVIE